ncbi:MAG: ROK family transcriptional regulator [Thermomicrobiales bacterium]|nr:ROK family transcriptional regulator [Thermomicrobiales bacterium]
MGTSVRPNGGRQPAAERGGALPALSPGQRAALRLIRHDAPLTRGALAQRIGLSASQVSRIIGDLRGLGLVTVEDRAAASGGRPSELLALARDGRFALGLDIAGGGLAGVAIDLHGEIVTRRASRLPGATARDPALAAMAAMVGALMTEVGATPERVLGVGVGLPAVVDPEAGVIVDWSETPGRSEIWAGFALRAALCERLPWARVDIDDCARMLALAEARSGQAVGTSDFLLVVADSGIGAATVIDGQPYRGANGLAGEIGHVSLSGEDALCACGKRGCLEAVASTTALLRQAATWQIDPEPTIASLIAAGDAGEARAAALLADAGARIGEVLATALNLLFPRLVVVGGALAESTVFLDALGAAAAERAHPSAAAMARVVPSALGMWGGALGAATVALDALFAPQPERRTAQWRG